MFCNVNVWCAGGGFFNLKHLYKISLADCQWPKARSAVTMLLSPGYTSADEKKINMMKVNFFFVLYVSLIEMLIDNHDYTH